MPTMRHMNRLAVALWICAGYPASFAQSDLYNPQIPPEPSHVHHSTEADKRLREQIFKEDLRKNAENAAELLALATDLKAEITRQNNQFVSARATKDTKQIENLARQIRVRLNRNIREIHF
jgi:plasmid stability protein